MIQKVTPSPDLSRFGSAPEFVKVYFQSNDLNTFVLQRPFTRGKKNTGELLW